MSNENDLLERILQSEKVEDSVLSIVNQSKQTGMSENDLSCSLVLSGLVVGVQETQKHFSEQTYLTLKLLKKLIVDINIAIMECSELDSIKAMDSVRRQIHGILSDRAEAIQSVLISNMEEHLGLDRKYLLDEQEPDDYTSKELASVGFMAYRKAAPYFIAWRVLNVENKLKAIPCGCYDCMVKHLVGRGIDEKSFMLDTFNKTRSMDMLFKDFGLFVVMEARKIRDSLTSGAQHEVPEPKENTEERLKKFFNRRTRK